MHYQSPVDPLNNSKILSQNPLGSIQRPREIEFPNDYGTCRKKPKTTRAWHPIEMAIVMQVARYGLATAAALYEAKVKGVKDRQQAENRLSALARRGDLVPHQLPTGEMGFTLSPSSSEKAKRLGFDAPVKIQSPDSFARAYALMSVCCDRHENKKLLTPTELSQHFPVLGRSCHRPSYYLVRESGQVQLGFVRLDRGGRGRWDRIARKTCDDMRKHLSHDWLRPLIDLGQFEICVVTALASKAARIDELLKAKQSLLPVPYRVVTIPPLIHFIRPQPG